MDQVARAREYAKVAHEGQLRDGGEPYFTHPCAVVAILQDHGVTNPEVIAAAYLHDVVEDTSISFADLEEIFSVRTVDLVRELTFKPDGVVKWSPEYIRALEIYHSKLSAAAVAIKLADRIHNLQSSRVSRTPASTKGYCRATVRMIKHLRGAHQGLLRTLNTLLAEIQGVAFVDKITGG